MKIAIIGTGGVGGYFGGKMAKAGFDVSFLARGDHYAAIKANGLNIKSTLGDFQIHPVKVTDSIEEIGISDLIIIAVKAWQTREISAELKFNDFAFAERGAGFRRTEGTIP
jgi:2-dehydropantoate 2-reductase